MSGPSPASVAVVSDSTCWLPDDVLERHDVARVPLTVVLDDEAVLAHDLSTTRLLDALRTRGARVTTSRPSPQQFTDTFRAVARRRDVRHVVAVLLSGRLSGTVEAARLAAQAVAADGLDVRVVDSRSLDAGLGFAVQAACEEAEAGGGPDDVVSAASDAELRTSLRLVVDDLEHLRRGGRIGAAAGWAAAALSVKPLLHVVDGQVAPLGKVRTSSRAASRLADAVVAESAGGPVSVVVTHLDAQARAERLAEALAERLPSLRSVAVTETSAVVGAHVGPGAVGVASHRHA